MSLLTIREILRGNPIDPAHEPNPADLVSYLELLEILASLSGRLYFRNNLLQLADIAGPVTGDNSIVLFDATVGNRGVYQYTTPDWTKVTNLPAGFTDALSALAATEVLEADLLALSTGTVIPFGATATGTSTAYAMTVPTLPVDKQLFLARLNVDSGLTPVLTLSDGATTLVLDVRDAGGNALDLPLVANDVYIMRRATTQAHVLTVPVLAPSAYATAAQGALAATAVQPAVLAAEVDDLEAADNALAALIAAIPENIDLPSLRNVAVDHLVHRPGDAPEHFDLSDGVIVTNAEGLAVRTDDSFRIVSGPRVAIETGRRYELRAAYRRNSGSADPANDAVVLGVDWLSNAGAVIGSLAANTDTTLTVATGRREVSKVLARTAESGINIIAPSATRYARPWVYTYGTDHTTDVEICALERLPANLLPGPTGPTGPKGAKGDTGAKGAKGDTGLKGDAGYSLAFALTDGASDNIANRPAVGSAEGATWGLISGDSLTIYVYAGGAWYSTGTITSTAAANIPNTIYVHAEGNNLLLGGSTANAVRSIERALEIAATRGGELTLIDLLGANGNAITQGHLDMPDNTAIRAVHRTWIMRPDIGFEERNLFRMGSGCFVEGLLSEGFAVDSLTDPTEGFFASFRPGAVIRRVPYVHKVAIRTVVSWGLVAPPLDRANGNPAVGRGGGVILADGLVCSQYSTFPNIMTWGATPVSHNGIGYCAKNGGLVNAVNAVSLWAHRHFYARSGGQIILSACSTQFGDYTLHADGFRSIVIPGAAAATFTVQTTASDAILAAETTIVDTMWAALVSGGYTATWDAEDETYTRSDAALFLRCIRWVLEYANEQPMLDFAKGQFNTVGARAFSLDKLPAFVFAFVHMRDSITALAGVDATADAIVTALVEALNDTLTDPQARKEPSRITAAGHIFSSVMAGVALTKIPPANNAATMQDSILETNEGVVAASGKDDELNEIFGGGLTISADTGELGGPPFEQAVRRIATRAAIARSF